MHQHLIDGLVSVPAFAGHTKTLEDLWAIEAVTAIWGIAGLLVTRSIGRRYPQPIESPVRPELPNIVTGKAVWAKGDFKKGVRGGRSAIRHSHRG